MFSNGYGVMAFLNLAIASCSIELVDHFGRAILRIYLGVVCIEGDDVRVEAVGAAGQGRVRVELNLRGYWLEKVGGRRTKVVHVTGRALKGVVTLDWINRRAMVARMQGVVEDMRKLGNIYREAGPASSHRRRLARRSRTTSSC